MKLQCKIASMFGTTIRVAPTIESAAMYQIDGNGVVDVDNEDHAKRLLAAEKTWRVYVARTPMAPEAPDTPPPPPTPPAPPTPPVEPPGASEEGEGESKDEYPEPTMKMTLAELRKLARVYEVDFTDKTTKRQLVDLLNDAMYE